MTANTDPEAIASLITVIGGLPPFTIAATAVVAMAGIYIYSTKLRKRSAESALIDVSDAQATALMRLVERMVEEGHSATAAQREAIAKLTEAVIDLRHAAAGQMALLGNLTLAVQDMGAKVDRANDKCLTCTSRDKGTY